MCTSPSGPVFSTFSLSFRDWPALLAITKSLNIALLKQAHFKVNGAQHRQHECRWHEDATCQLCTLSGWTHDVKSQLQKDLLESLFTLRNEHSPKIAVNFSGQKRWLHYASKNSMKAWQIASLWIDHREKLNFFVQSCHATHKYMKLWKFSISQHLSEAVNSIFMRNETMAQIFQSWCTQLCTS